MKTFEQDFIDQINISESDITSFAIKVSKFFTTVDGTIIDKSLVPIELQTRYPVVLFFRYDSFGSYRISFNENPLSPNTFFYRAYTQNDGFDPTQFSGLNTINRELNIGDQVFVYADDVLNPNFFIYVIQSVTDRALSSIVKSIPCSGLPMGNLKYFADNELNFGQTIKIVKTDKLGLYKADSYSPDSIRTPDYQQNRLALIPLTGNRLTPYWGLVTYITHESDLLTFDFEFLNVK